MVESCGGEIAGIGEEERVGTDRERRRVPHPRDHDRAEAEGKDKAQQTDGASAFYGPMAFKACLLGHGLLASP